MHLRHKLLDLFFPPKCPFCNRVITSGCYICTNCNDKVFLLENIQTAVVENEVYHGKCIAPYAYEDKIQSLLIQFKFHQKPQYDAFFGEKLAQAILIKNLAESCEIVVSVPISKQRYRERGYNQSALLAKRVAAYLGIPYVNTLVKIRHNAEQHHLPAQERKNNVIGVYDLKESRHITNKKVLLIDDIVTTGFTLAECAGVLLQHGAEQVLCGAVARRANVYAEAADPFEEACKNCKI